MSKRKRRTKSAVASFIRNVKAEIGQVDYGTQETPLLYPPLKIISRYPEFTEDQQELIHYSRNFLSKVLNSPFYQLFKKTSNSHFLIDQSEDCANEFVKNIIKQRPLFFPEELKKKVKYSKDKNTEGAFLASGEEDSEKSEEKEVVEVSDSEIGIWDGNESDHGDSEEII